MALSKCVKCNSMKFEHKIAEPAGSRFKLAFIQCAACGGVVGVMDYYNIGAQITGLEKRLERIEAVLAQVEARRPY